MVVVVLETKILRLLLFRRHGLPPGRAHVGGNELAAKEIVLPASILLLGELTAERRLACTATWTRRKS